jgi:hypothetical protein
LSPGQSFRVFFTSNWKRKSQTRECSTTYMSREKHMSTCFRELAADYDDTKIVRCPPLT